MNTSVAFADPDLGFQGFTVERRKYRRQSGTSALSDQRLPASGCVQPGTPEMIQLLPAEERNAEFIAVYTEFPLCLGRNGGRAAHTVPDRIFWNGETWRVVKVRDWAMFGYYEALAVKQKEQ